MHLLPLYILATANLIALIHIGLYIIGGNTYDMLKIKKDHDKNRHPSDSKDANSQDLFSVIIPAHNEAKNIGRTLDSVLSSNYHNIEIIVVNDGSVDDTERVVHDYIAKIQTGHNSRIVSYLAREGRSLKFRRRYIRVYQDYRRMVLINQPNLGKAAAMNKAIKTAAKGRYVMCLDADSVLHPKAISRAAAYFEDWHIIGVAANVRIMENPSILGIVQRFEHMIGYRAKKFYSLTNSEFILGGVASSYRRSTLKKVKFYDNDTMTEDIGLSLKIVEQIGNTKQRLVYGADVVAYTEGVQSFRDLMSQRYRWKMGNLQNLFKYKQLIGRYNPEKYSRALTIYRLPMALTSELLLIIEPLLLTYIIYLSLTYHTLGIILGAYLTITVYVFCVLWPDEHLSLKEKMKMSGSALIIYLYFYVMDVVQICAIFKTLLRYRQITHRETSASTWLSPIRSGQTARVYLTGRLKARFFTLLSISTNNN